MKTKGMQISFSPRNNPYLSTPTTLARETDEYARNLEGIAYGIGILDRLSLPMRRTELMIWQGRPGSRKTTFTLALADLIGKNNPDKGAPLFVTRETVNEDLGIYLMAKISPYTVEDFYRERVPKREVTKYAMRLANLNLNVLGHKAEGFGSGLPDLDMNVVYKSYQGLLDDGEPPCIIVIDYAQKFEPADATWRDSQQQKTADVIKEVEQFVLAVGVPTILMAQSRREVDQYEIPIPLQGDTQFSSMAEKVCSRMHGLLAPANIPKWNPNTPNGKFVDIHGKTYENSHKLLIINNSKNRGLPAFGTIGIEFDPGTLEITELESYDFNNMQDMTEERRELVQAEIGL